MSKAACSLWARLDVQAACRADVRCEGREGPSKRAIQQSHARGHSSAHEAGRQRAVAPTGWIGYYHAIYAYSTIGLGGRSLRSRRAGLVGRCDAVWYRGIHSSATGSWTRCRKGTGCTARGELAGHRGRHAFSRCGPRHAPWTGWGQGGCSARLAASHRSHATLPTCLPPCWLHGTNPQVVGSHVAEEEYHTTSLPWYHLTARRMVAGRYQLVDGRQQPYPDQRACEEGE